MSGQQGKRQKSARNQHNQNPPAGSTYNDDLMKLFTSDGIPAGEFNGRLLQWINDALGTDHKNLNGAMAAWAEFEGAGNWSGVDDLTPPAP